LKPLQRDWLLETTGHREMEAFDRAIGATRPGQEQQKTLGAALAAHVREALATFGIIICATIAFYVILLYMPTFARTQLHLPLDQAFTAQAISLACMIVRFPSSARCPIILAVSQL
jgi:hypothetical protein